MPVRGMGLEVGEREGDGVAVKVGVGLGETAADNNLANNAPNLKR